MKVYILELTDVVEEQYNHTWTMIVVAENGSQARGIASKNCYKGSADLYLNPMMTTCREIPTDKATCIHQEGPE